MRYTELDGLRGLAALSVFFSHFIGVFPFTSMAFKKISYSPIHLLWNGEGAVFLFFLLSGFVLTLPYVKQKNKLRLFDFYVKRVFRIYPAFLSAIVFSIMIKSFFFQAEGMKSFSNWINEFWKWNFNDLVLSDYFNTLVLIGKEFDVKLFNPVIGTLRTEMIISFFLPFMIFIAFRLKFMLNLIVMIILFTLDKDIWGVFYLGIIIAFYKDTIFYHLFKLNSKMILLLLVIASILYTSRFSLMGGIGGYSKISFLLTVIGCLLFLLVAIKPGKLNNLLNTKVVQFLGRISYSLYLVHFPILLFISSIVSNRFILLFSFPIILLFSLSTTLIVSFFFYKYIEKPFIQYGKNITSNFRLFFGRRVN